MTDATDAMRAANTKHGFSGSNRTGEYEAWSGAKNRCSNPNHASYKRYGARGITMDPKWVDDFPAFLADMGPKPSPKHSLDRIDNDGPYSPGNCRWATAKEQSRNRRSCMTVFYEGRQMSLVDACDLAGVPYDRVNARISVLGWSFDRAISQPKRGAEPKSRAKVPSRPFQKSRTNP